ncbi:MAG: MFS transporter, partial [Deltaproteobacteria bacterium]|nr:MFS transporter [Deltaproteobacteria bacterium]
MFSAAMTDQPISNSSEVPLAPKREIFAWAMYDFANSGYTTVVLTTIFNTYFVSVIAGSVSGFESGTPTLLWSITIALANAIVLLTAPVVGVMADQRALKKTFLAVSTAGCALSTAALAWIGPGDVVAAMILVILATVMFSSGENLIASFLPEIAPVKDLGRISGYGWGLGYIGGMITLLACLGYISKAEQAGLETQAAIPGTLLITAAIFALAAIPTFLWLKERGVVNSEARSWGLRASVANAVCKTLQTLKHASHYRDLFRFLLSLTLYNCGVYT